VTDRFLGLRHYAVVGGHYQNGDVGAVGSTGPHGRKGFVAGCIDEGHRALVSGYAISPNVLRDTALLTGDNVGADYPVQKGGLSVVDVTEEGGRRGARLEGCRVVFLLGGRYQGLLQIDLVPEIDLCLEGLGQ